MLESRHVTRAMIATMFVAAGHAGAPVARAQATSPAKNPRVEALLDRLAGNWTMTGQVMGKPAVYKLTTQRTLGGRYVELHMIDTGASGYEARVGFSTTRHSIEAFGTSM